MKTSSALGRVDGIPTHEILTGLGQLHQLVLVSDLSGRIVWMSDALGMICGGVETLVGRRVTEVLANGVQPPVSVGKQLEMLHHELEERDLAAHFRLDLARRDGSPLSLDVSAFRVDGERVDDEGIDDELAGPAASESLNVAIVHPLRLDDDGRELREAVDFLGAVLDSLPSAAIALDTHGFITYANPAVDDVLCRRPDELVGQPIAVLMPLAPDHRQLFSKRLITAAQEEGFLAEQEVRVRRHDGSTIWVALSARPLRPRGGEAIGTVAYLRDVTREREARERLERENAELDAYVHSVSHDLRSPLVSLLGFTRLLKQDYGRVFDDTGSHFLDRVEQAGRTMQSLIHDLLELSRIGKPGDRRDTLVDPRSVLLQIQAEIKLRLDEQGIELSLPASPPLLRIDRTRLYQVFSNLIGNAVTHMRTDDPALGQPPRITVEVEPDGPEASGASHHRVTVRDNGRGIPPEAQERIFEVFQTARSGRGAGRSTGMGLAIVKKIAESQGGRVWVESEPGCGAAFHVTMRRG